MEINSNYGIAYQIRFETFRFQNPSFTRSQNNPFIYQFVGGCIGFLRTFVDHDFHLGFNSSISVNDEHFLFNDNQDDWLHITSPRKYNLSLYKYLWVGSYDSIQVTQV